jgi:chromosome segregation ATPase
MRDDRKAGRPAQPDIGIAPGNAAVGRFVVSLVRMILRLRSSVGRLPGAEGAVREFESRLIAIGRIQSELLVLLHRSTLDVVTARKRLEARIEDFEAHEAQARSQHDQAVAGAEDQAETLERWSEQAQARIATLRADLAALQEVEDQLTERSAQMQEQVSDFRVAMDLAYARLALARTSGVADEVLGTLGDAVTYMEMAIKAAIPKAPSYTE